MQQDYTDISVILDRSGSMFSVVNDTIGGFNKFIEDQKTQPGRALISLYQFNTEYQVMYKGRAVQEAPLLNEKTFLPEGGTALLDAIGKTINDTGARLRAMPENDRPGKVLFIIITDGEENSSHEFNASKINQMITHQKTNYSWDFVFMGANQDAVLTAARYGIARGSSITYAANSIGTARAFHSVSNYTSSHRASGNASFSDKDREDQKEAGAI